MCNPPHAGDLSPTVRGRRATAVEATPSQTQVADTRRMLFEAGTMFRDFGRDIFNGTKLLWCLTFLSHDIAMSESSKTDARNIPRVCVTRLAHVISGLCLARYSVLVHDLPVQKWRECHLGRGYMLAYIAV